MVYFNLKWKQDGVRIINGINWQQDEGRLIKGNWQKDEGSLIKENWRRDGLTIIWDLNGVGFIKATIWNNCIRI